MVALVADAADGLRAVQVRPAHRNNSCCVDLTQPFGSSVWTIDCACVTTGGPPKGSAQQRCSADSCVSVPRCTAVGAAAGGGVPAARAAQAAPEPLARLRRATALCVCVQPASVFLTSSAPHNAFRLVTRPAPSATCSSPAPVARLVLPDQRPGRAVRAPPRPARRGGRERPPDHQSVRPRPSECARRERKPVGQRTQNPKP